MDDRIARAVNLLEMQIDRDVDYHKLAAAVGLSRHHFHRLFMQHLNETPNAYLRRIRVDLAAMRLCWTRESVGEIAQGLGYASQGSFNRAFIGRFGTAPGRFRADFMRLQPEPRPKSHGVTVRESPGLECLARRYRGPLKNVPENWNDFLARLPESVGMQGRAMFIGRTFDDPRFTAPDQIRYDCCVTLPAAGMPEVLDGLVRVRTRGGLYATIGHRGPYQPGIGTSYSLILDSWMANSTRYVMADDPALEAYGTPPGRCTAADLECMIMVPLI